MPAYRSRLSTNGQVKKQKKTKKGGVIRTGGAVRTGGGLEEVASGALKAADAYVANPEKY